MGHFGFAATRQTLEGYKRISRKVRLSVDRLRVICSIIEDPLLCKSGERLSAECIHGPLAQRFLRGAVTGYMA